MCMAFLLTFHSNVVNNNMFQYLMMFMFCKQFLLNAVITRISTSLSLIMHTFVYQIKMSWQNFKSYGRI